MERGQVSQRYSLTVGKEARGVLLDLGGRRAAGTAARLPTYPVDTASSSRGPPMEELRMKSAARCA